ATTSIAGIVIPSTSPVFLTLVGVHVLLALFGVVAGLVAMLSVKGSARHIRCGTLYYWGLVGVSLSASALAAIRWREDWLLFVLGLLGVGCATTGRIAVRRKRLRTHLAAMAASYVVMLIAFYVDNGKNLPIWRDLPVIAYWVLPAGVGLIVTAF